jgi:hypothetical protein
MHMLMSCEGKPDLDPYRNWTLLRLPGAPLPAARVWVAPVLRITPHFDAKTSRRCRATTSCTCTPPETPAITTRNGQQSIINGVNRCTLRKVVRNADINALSP